MTENIFLGMSVGAFITVCAGVGGLYGVGYHSGSAEWRAKVAEIEKRDPVLVFARKCAARHGMVIVHEQADPIDYVCRVEGNVKP